MEKSVRLSVGHMVMLATTMAEQTGEVNPGADIVFGSIKLILILLAVAVVFVVLFGSTRKKYKRK